MIFAFASTLGAALISEILGLSYESDPSRLDDYGDSGLHRKGRRFTTGSDPDHRWAPSGVSNERTRPLSHRHVRSFRG